MRVITEMVRVPICIAPVVCSGCNLRRTPREFSAHEPERVFVYCAVCRSKGKSRKTVKVA